MVPKVSPLWAADLTVRIPLILHSCIASYPSSLSGSQFFYCSCSLDTLLYLKTQEHIPFPLKPLLELASALLCLRTNYQDHYQDHYYPLIMVLSPIASELIPFFIYQPFLLKMQYAIFFPFSTDTYHCLLRTLIGKNLQFTEYKVSSLTRLGLTSFKTMLSAGEEYMYGQKLRQNYISLSRKVGDNQNVLKMSPKGRHLMGE